MRAAVVAGWLASRGLGMLGVYLGSMGPGKSRRGSSAKPAGTR